MGHIVNPISFRLGVTKFWKNTGVNLYDKFFKDITFHNKNAGEFIEWFYKSHYFGRRGAFVLRGLSTVKAMDSRSTSFFVDKFFYLFHKYWLSIYFFYYLFEYVELCFLNTVFELRDQSNARFTLVTLGLKDLNDNFEYDFEVEDEGLSSKLGCFYIDEVRTQKHKEMTDFLEKLETFEDTASSSYREAAKQFLASEHRVHLEFLLWYNKVFFEFSPFLSRLSLMFEIFRYMDVFSNETDDENSPDLFYHMLAGPELSHFVVYRSGFYSTKILLYVSHPSLLSLVNELEDDWASSIFFEEEFKNNVFNIDEDLKEFNLCKLEFLSVVFFLVFFYNIISKNYKAIFKVFLRTLKHQFDILFTDYREMFFQLNALFEEDFETDRDIFANYVKLKRSFFYFSLGAFETSRTNLWFQKTITSLLAREYERTWLKLLEEKISFMLRPNRFFLKVFFIESRVITTRLLFNFFCRHLRQRKPVNTILGMIVGELKRQKALIGFKILTAGRFTRRERALYKWHVFERTPLSLYGSYLDYFCGVYKSRFGVCSFKFWFFKE